jgi:hypothetical protein
MAAEDICVYIHHDGYPIGAAEYFRKALFIAKTDRRPILEAFIAANSAQRLRAATKPTVILITAIR